MDVRLQLVQAYSSLQGLPMLVSKNGRCGSEFNHIRPQPSVFSFVPFPCLLQHISSQHLVSNLEIILYDPLPLLVLPLLFLLDPLICRLEYFCLFLEDLVQSHCQEGTHGMADHRTAQLHVHACTYKGSGNTYPAHALKWKRISLGICVWGHTFPGGTHIDHCNNAKSG